MISGEVSREETMLSSGTGSGSYITEYTLVHEDWPPAQPDMLEEPQKALRGVIPASLCLVLGAILWEIVVKN